MANHDPKELARDIARVLFQMYFAASGAPANADTNPVLLFEAADRARARANDSFVKVKAISERLNEIEWRHERRIRSLESQVALLVEHGFAVERGSLMGELLGLPKAKEGDK